MFPLTIEGSPVAMTPEGHMNPHLNPHPSTGFLRREHRGPPGVSDMGWKRQFTGSRQFVG